MAGVAEDVSPAAGTLQVGDSAASLELRGTDGHWHETSFNVGGTAFPYVGALWQIETDAGVLEPGPAQSVQTEIGPEGRCTGVVFTGRADPFDWDLTYEASQGRIIKRLLLTATSPMELRRVTMFAADQLAADEVASTGLQDIAAFYRKGDSGFFASLDYPWSRIDSDGKQTTVSYPPVLTLAPGEAHSAHSLTLVPTALTGQHRYGRDTGEVLAMDRYVQERFPPRFDRPMNVSCSIVNRYTMPTRGVIWYTYKDHPTFSRNLDLLRREIDLLPQLGMEYYQVFPGVFDWAPGDPDPDTVRGIVDYANERGVRIGDYSGCNSVFCPHYNEHGNTLERPEWRMVDEAGNPSGFCFGSPEFADYYAKTVSEAAAAFGFELHCLDFLSLEPCYAEGHNHPPGRDSLYSQVRGLVQVLEALNATDPDMMIWSNSGNWVDFLPKIAWWNQNLYLTDPAIHTPWQGLNMTRLLDDARREQMVSLHYSHFLPYRFYSNCQYFFSQNSVIPDIRAYQYGALASLAVTPNLCLAEVRPWLDTLPAGKREDVLHFYQEWTKRIAGNYALWTRTYNAGEDPAPGNVEIYGHADGDHGFVFVVNPNFWREQVEVTLDESLGFAATGRCELRELHPTPRYLLTNAGPTPPYGATLQLDLSAREVLVFEVSPAPAQREDARLYGVEGLVSSTQEGYVAKIRGAQGSTAPFAVAVPEAAAPVLSATVDDNDPPQAKRLFAATDIKVIERANDGATSFELCFRRTEAPAELRQWQAKPESLETGLELGLSAGFADGTPVLTPLWERASADDDGLVMEHAPVMNFGGGYIENAFSELQETTVYLETSSGESPRAAEPRPDPEVQTTSMKLAENETGAPNWWFSTSFHLPFMYTIGAEPQFYEHPLVVFPMRDPAKVTELRAWMNGAPLNVERYRYPRNRDLSTWWADLVGSAASGGTNTLVVFATFAG